MQTFNIDIAQSPAPLVLYAKQGDSLSRFFQINFLQNGQPWTPPAGALFAVRYGVPSLPSGWYDTIQEPDGSSHSAFGLSGNVLTVEIAYEAVSVSGRNTLCVLVLDSNGYQLGAWNLALQVEITPGENAPESTQYYSLLSAQVAQVLAATEDARGYATEARSWAEGGTGSRAGEDTDNAEYWAGQAKTEAQKALGFRAISGAVVPEAGTGNVDPTSPMLMSSLTATSAADRLDHVVVPGKTTQAGSGDPSPSNVRPIKGTGRKMATVVLDGTSVRVVHNETWTSQNENGIAFFYVQSQSMPTPAKQKTTVINDVFPIRDTFNQTASEEGIAVLDVLYIAIKKDKLNPVTSTQMNLWLRKNPLTVRYVPEDESQATEWYTWEAVDGAEYAAVGLPLNGQLYDGDKVSNDEPSGCDVEITFDQDTSIIIQSINSNGIVNVQHTVDFLLKSYTCLSNKFPRDTKYIVDAKTEGVFNFDFDVYIRLLESTLEPYGHTKGSTETALTAAKAFFAEHPITVLVKSPQYTAKNDIRAEIETHGDILYTLTGEEAYTATGEGWAPGAVFISNFMVYAKPVEGYASKASIVCSHLATETPANVTNRGYQGCAQGGGTSLYLNFGDPYNTKELAVQYIKDQYAAGTPVQIKAKRATPAVYAHPAQPLKNPAGTWTLSAENTPVGYMRPLTDADRADYAEQADNADQLGGQPPAWYMPTGAVITFAGSAAPAGWLLCDGSTVSRTTYAALFAAIGATYGAGDGNTTFALPDLRGRVAAGANASNALASKAGADSKQITRANLPAEKLNLEDNGIWIVDSVQTGSESGRTLQMGTRSGAARLETNTLGSGTAFDVRQATLYLNYIIKY